MLDDLRHALRRLRSRPALILAAAAMLGLGIGLTTAMFTLVDALVLRPVPFRDAERLTSVMMLSSHTGRQTVSPAVLDAWRRSPAFAAAEGATTGVSIVETGSRPDRPRQRPGLAGHLRHARCASGARPRPSTPVTVAPAPTTACCCRKTSGAPRSAPIPDLIGRRITIDGASAVVVGLMPANFRFPEWNTVVWRPLDFAAPPPASAGVFPQPFLRLAPGVPMNDAMKIALAAARRADPSIPPDTQAMAAPLGGMTMDPGTISARCRCSAAVSRWCFSCCARTSAACSSRG